MIRMSRLISAAAVLALAAAALALPASAGVVKIGVLTCHIEGGAGMVIYSRKDLRCVFRRASGGREWYRGAITKVGLDLGRTSGATLVWSVFAPGRTGRGALAGTYAGATAEFTPGAGYGANALIGGLRHGIALQPLSLQAQTGLNIAAGVASLTLRRER